MSFNFNEVISWFFSDAVDIKGFSFFEFINRTYSALIPSVVVPYFIHKFISPIREDKTLRTEYFQNIKIEKSKLYPRFSIGVGAYAFIERLPSKEKLEEALLSYSAFLGKQTPKYKSKTLITDCDYIKRFIGKQVEQLKLIRLALEENKELLEAKKHYAFNEQVQLMEKAVEKIIVLSKKPLLKFLRDYEFISEKYCTEDEKSFHIDDIKWREDFIQEVKEKYK